MLPDASVNMGLNIALYVKRHIVAQSVERILQHSVLLSKLLSLGALHRRKKIKSEITRTFVFFIKNFS